MHQELILVVKGQASISNRFQKVWQLIWSLNGTQGDRVFL